VNAIFCASTNRPFFSPSVEVIMAMRGAIARSRPLMALEKPAVQPALAKWWKKKRHVEGEVRAKA